MTKKGQAFLSERAGRLFNKVQSREGIVLKATINASDTFNIFATLTTLKSFLSEYNSTSFYLSEIFMHCFFIIQSLSPKCNIIPISS